MLHRLERYKAQSRVEFDTADFPAFVQIGANLLIEPPENYFVSHRLFSTPCPKRSLSSFSMRSKFPCAFLNAGEEALSCHRQFNRALQDRYSALRIIQHETRGN
jgi:hypothetical protein